MHRTPLSEPGSRPVVTVIPLLRASRHMPYAYMNIPKAGCSTIKNTLWALEHAQGHIPHLPRSSEELHGLVNTPWHDLRGRKYDEVATLLSGKYLFSVVRNPFERVLSAYLDKICRRLPPFHELCGLSGWPPEQDMSFTQFLELVTSTPVNKMNPHWRPQARILFNFPLAYALIGRLEDVNQVMQHVGSSMSLPDRVQLLEYTPHATSAAKHLREWYQSDATTLVTKIYQEDFETFDFDLRPEM